MMTLFERTEMVKQCARNLGFSAVGITSAEPLGEEFVQYQEWLRREYHGGTEGAMQYMERHLDKRGDVRSILPSAQSIIVVAQNYYTPCMHEKNVPDTGGKISRYAWGDDYHEVIPPKLRLLCDAVRECDPDSETKVYTDTGAIMEKAYAVRAGIGWQGKHSNVIHRGIGSWFFIGVIITSTQFLYDTPHDDFCGTCTACIGACPTQAIVEPYLVDARRCISYWTIETKPQHEIPSAIAESMDEWLFGCDTCQDVCPWNRFQTPTQEEAFMPRNNETRLMFQRIETYSQEEFSRRFRKSPLKRTKLAGLRRNARALQQSKNVSSPQ